MLLVSSPVYSQRITASLGDVVHDPSESVVPGAVFRIVNRDTAVVTTWKIDYHGRFFVPSLPPALFDISAEDSGFKRMMTAGYREPTKCTTSPETPSCWCSDIHELNPSRRGEAGRAEVVKRPSTNIRASKLTFKLLTILAWTGRLQSLGSITGAVSDPSGATVGKSLLQRRLV